MHFLSRGVRVKMLCRVCRVKIIIIIIIIIIAVSLVLLVVVHHSGGHLRKQKYSETKNQEPQKRHRVNQFKYNFEQDLQAKLVKKQIVTSS